MADKTPEQCFEDGYVSISLGAYKLGKSGLHKQAYDEIQAIIDLLQEDQLYIYKKLSNDNKLDALTGR